MSVDYRPDYDPADVDSDYGHTGGDITVPTFTANMQPFRFWCQKALPLVYDDSLSYYEVLCKVVKQMNDFLTDLQTATGAIDQFAQQFVINQQFLNDMADQLGQNVQDLEDYINDRLEDYMTAYTQLQNYVNNYFDNLDVQQEINNKLDEMASAGTLNDLFDPVLETWMQQKTSQIDQAIEDQDAVQAAQNGRISVLEGRMDTFASLPSGSTSGNAELLDIRTNFLGEVYPSAGDAVRASDMIASGFQSISATKLTEWDGNDDSSLYDTIQIDIGGYKGGHVVVIGSFYNFQFDLNNMGTCSVYATNTPGKVEDANAGHYLPGVTNSIFKNFTQLTTDISGEERLLLQFAIPDDFTYQYLKIGHLEHNLLPDSYTEPLYIVYANSWSKTPVDDTLSIAGDAADAKATGDAIDELNERFIKVTGYEPITFTNGKYIKTGGLNVGDTVNLTPVIGYNTNNYAIVDAQEGDKFTINNSTGGNAGRLWCFVDNNNVLLSVSDIGVTVTNLILTAPANASKLIINPVTGYGDIYKGVKLFSALEEVNDTISASLSGVDVVSNAVHVTGTPTLNRIDLLDAFYTVENNTVKRTVIVKVKASFENSDTYTLGTLSGLSPENVNPATNTVVFTAKASDGSNLSNYTFILTNSVSGNLCVVTSAPYTAGYGDVITLTSEQNIVTTTNHIVETAKNEQIYNDLQTHRNIFDSSFGRDNYAWNINNNAIGNYNNWSYTQVRVLENISVCITGLSESASTLGYAVLTSNGTVLKDGGVSDGMIIDIPAGAYYLILSYPTADKDNIVIKPYKKHKVVVLGDSWSDNDPTHTTFTKWTTILQNDGRFEVIVYAQNGSTITGDTPNYAQNGNVLGQVNKLIEDKIENVDTVIMFGGINDFRGGVAASAVYGKLSEFYNTVNTLYPTARIIYISNNQIFITKEQLIFFHTIHEYLRENIGLECFDTFGWVKPYNYLSDNVHVDNEGYKDLYANILSILCGGSVVTVNTENELTLSSGGSLCGALTIDERWANGYPVYSAKLVVYSAGLNKTLTRDITTSEGLLLTSVPFTKIVNKHLPSAVGVTGAVFMCDCAETFSTTNKLNTSNTLTVITPTSNAGTYVTDNFI